MRLPGLLIAVLGLSLLGGPVGARASEGEAVFEVSFQNPGLVPSQWELEFRPDGTGALQDSARIGARRRAGRSRAPDIDKDIRLSTQFAARIYFGLAEKKKLFKGGCESHMKVAFQGTKKLTYMGPAGRGLVLSSISQRIRRFRRWAIRW